jgi:sarcosine oxidase subunit beta
VSAAPPARAALPEGAEVVVVGGGVVGCSVAFHLAEAGVDVLLVERDTYGAGSSSKAAGGVRACFSDAVNVALGKRSLALLRDIGTRPGGEIDLHTCGYLFLLTTAEQIEEFGHAVEVHRSLGVRSSLVDTAEAARRSPLAHTDDVLGACWSPDDGTVTPEAVVQAYAAGARRAGARLVAGAEVVGADVTGGEVRSVTVRAAGADHVVATGTVVVAAGAWSQSVGDLLGFELPVRPLKREIVVTGPVPGFAPDVPQAFTIDAATTFYFHREGPGILTGWSDPDTPYGFDLSRDPAYLEGIVAQAEHRAPRLLDAEVIGGWAGLYEVSPDHDGIVGELGSVSRVLYATGFSGHGFLQGPALGETLRDLVLRRDPQIDVSALSLDRFGLGLRRDERHLV